MQGPNPSPPATLRDSLPADPFGDAGSQRVPAFGAARLQPVVLGPPPEAGPADVTAADDIDLQELRGKPRTGLYAGVMAALAIGATVGAAWWTLRPQEDQAGSPPPAIQSIAPPAAPITVAEPPPPVVPAEPVDMARIDGELVPPTTDGLSPARRIPTIRIVVENDREIIAPR
jgi:hypothetical protein